MEVGDWESHVISGMRDPEARVRVKAYKIARLMPSKGLQSELETTARSGKATLRAVSKFAPGEEPNRQVFYTPALKDAQEALLLLAFLKAPCASELATRHDQGPIKELALALLGEPQRLQKRHFERDLEAYALELVLRQRGAYGLEWATAIGFPERQRIVEVLRQHDAPEPGLWAKSPTTWWKKHGTAYQSKMRQR